MSAISLKSITGITSITTPAGVDNQLTLHTNNTTERFKIDEAGNVRVANTFDCVGVSTFRNNLFAQADLRIAGEIVHLSDDDTRMQFPSNDTIAFKTAGTERFRITSDGRIGINDSTPNDYELDILKRDAATDAQIRLYNNGTASSNDTVMRYQIGGTTANNYIYFGDSADVNAGQIRYSHSSNFLSVHTNAAERLRITSTGDILTGALTSRSFENDSTNQTILEVTGGGSVGNYGVLNISGNTNSSTPVGRITFVNRENSAATSTSNAGSKALGYIDVYAETSDSNAGDDSGGYMRFATKPESGGSAERLRIKSDGTVFTVTQNKRFGIGQDPDATTMGATSGTWQVPEVDGQTIGSELRLGDINTNSTAVIRLASYGSGDNGTGGGAIMFTNTRNGSASHHSDIAAIKGARESLGKGYLRFFTANQGANDERLRIDSGGALLVNRTAKYASSSEKLSVNGMTSIQGSSTSSAALYVFNTETTADGTVQPFIYLHDGNGIRGGLGLQYSTSNFIINANNVIQFRTGSSGVGGSERARIHNGGLLVNKTSTSDYGRFEVKGPTADNIDTTSDIRTKTVATFSGGSPGTTAAGKGMGIVIKPIADRGSHYFFGAANDSTNQEAHGRFIIKSGHLASSSVERLRIASDGKVELTETLLPRVDNAPSIGNGTKNFNSIWASTRFRGNDNVKLVLGNSQDFVIYHDGSGTNFINSPQGGSLHIKSGTLDNANLRHMTCDYGGSTVIYHQNGASEGERIRTTNTGITFGGEVNFSSGNNVRTFVGSFTLSDGQHADIVQNNSGYTWGFFEFYCLSYHGSIGRARWVGSMSRYSNNDNYPTINNSMGYTNLLRVATGSPSGQVNMIRVQRTGTYGNVTYNLYVRCIAPNSVPNWSGAGYGTLKYDGN